MAARLGRMALLLQAEAIQELAGLDEPVVFDHFETFAFSQDDRVGIGTAVGQRSWFVYAFDPAPHRRAGRIAHQIYPNPPRGPGHDPAIARERDRAMFAVDLPHKLLRHSQAHHRRETIAFGRRTNALIERAALMAVWRNFVKGVSERRNDPTTPAMRLGLTVRAWKWRDVFSRRRFPGRNLPHALHHAF
jgi:hypothetical protein